jgi:alkaline phosphatase D
VHTMNRRTFPRARAYAPNIYSAPGGNVRLHSSREITTLEDYRNRHAQYKTDPDLQAAHAAFPGS